MSGYKDILDVVNSKGEQSWPSEVGEILSAINKRASFYMWLGYGVYGLGSIAIMFLMRNHATLATAMVMFFFQLCVIFFGTKVMYQNIGGAFWLSIAANRDAVPTFKAIATQSRELGDTLKQAALDIRTAGDRIQNEVAALRVALTAPIKPPAPLLKAPLKELSGVHAAVAEGSNGSGH